MPKTLLPASTREGRGGIEPTAPGPLWIGAEPLLDEVGGAESSRLFTVRFTGLAGPDEVASGHDTGVAAVESPRAKPCAVVGNRVLGLSRSTEIWRSGSPVSRGSSGPVDWSENGTVLFGSLATRLRGSLSTETEAHFDALLAAVEERGFPHLLRVWNYLPGINGEENGTERYRLFNCGRAAAFDNRYGVDTAEARFSASSAVGSSGSRLVTYFVSGRSPGRHLGNPRQVHAFRYPSEYGPRPPSFTRATISPPEAGQILFLSGTASIAGHETVHAGILHLQLEETLHNIEALLAAGGGAGAARLPAFDEFDLIRVYLRDANDFEIVREQLLPHLGARTELLFVEADICRADLLLEIEGIAGLPRQSF